MLIDDGANRQCRAVPSEEWPSQLERQFHARKQAAPEALAGLSDADYDDRMYRLSWRTQVLEPCRGMLGRCRHVAVMGIVPGVVTDLAGDIGAAVIMTLYDKPYRFARR